MAPKPGRSSIGVRVRPNANEFIRDLERQLAGKKHTFYVDVKANLKPANRDIQEWSRTTLKRINAVIPVRATMGKATVDVAEWRKRQRGIVTNIPVGVDLSKAYASVLAFRKFAGNDIEVALKVSTESANKAAERFQQAVARRGITLGDVVIGVDADTALVGRKIEKVKREAQKDKIKTPLELEVDDAQRKLRTLQIEAAAKKLGVKVDIDADPTKANLQLKLLKAKAAASKLEVNVDVKRQGIDGFMKALSSIEKRLGGGSIIRSLDFGPLNLGKPGGLMGTLTTVNLLAGAVPGAVFAITGLSKAITDMAGAASIAPGALGALAASIGTFAVGFSGVGEAFSAMTDMWTEGASDQASTARRSVQAHNQLRQAVRDEAQAQRDVGSARREATNDLRNLNNELRGGVLNEAQAILDLQKARDRYAQGNFDNATDERQAALDIAKAQDSLINVRERNGQLQQKANEESAKGVEGSDKVTQAQERVTQAMEATATAMEAIRSAQATGTLGKFQDELNQLTPSAQDFVMAIAGFKGQMMEVRNATQETMFAGTGDAFRAMFSNLLPVVGPGMQRIAGAMNQSILQVFDSLGSPQGQGIIDRILGGTAETQEHLTKLIDPVVRGVGTLMAAGAEHLPQVVDLFTRLADRFANFIENADRTGKLDSFMDRGVDALGKLAELGINLIQIVNNLGGAFKGDMLQGLVDVTQKFEDWIVSAEGQQKINQWIEDAKALWEDWKPVLEDLPEIFDAVSGAAKTLIDGITPFLNLFTSVMKEAPGLVKGFVMVWLGSKLITGFLSPVASLLGGILKGFRALPGLAAAAANAASALPAWAGGGGGAAAANAAGGATVGGALATAAGVVAPIAIAGGAALTTVAVTPKDYSVPKEEADRQINELDAKLPAGIPKSTSTEARQAMESAAATSGAAAWVNSPPIGHGGQLEFSRRYNWLMSQPNAMDLLSGGKGNFVAPPGFKYYENEVDKDQKPITFMGGGYTSWGAKQGRMIEAHGGEYIEPKHTVDHYGVDAMRAVHQKRAVISYQGGGEVVWDPNTGTFVPQGTPITHGQNTSGAPQSPGIVNSVGNNLGSFGQGFMNSLGIPGMNGNGNQQQDQGPGWGEGGAPIGLGGGDGFDIRRFGIGPGPAGSGPNDWMQHTGETLGKFGAGLVGEFSKGLLGAFGLEGILGSPYFAGATGLLGHFLNPDQGKGVQASGAAETNSQVTDLLNTANGMPTNPPTGAPSGLPDVFDPSTGSALNWDALMDAEAGSSGGWKANTGNGFFGGLQFDQSTWDQYRGAAGVGVARADLATREQQIAVAQVAYNARGGGSTLWPANHGLLNSGGAAVSATGAGNSGLQINTARGKQIIQSKFPWATNIGGVRSDPKPYHPNGLALDVMTDPSHGNNDPPSPQGLAKGNQLYAWLKQNQAALGIDYLMWGPVTGDADHYNHIHVNFAPSGYAPGTGPTTGLTEPPKASKGGWSNGNWKLPGATPPAPAKKPGGGDPKKLFGTSFAGGGWVPGMDWVPTPAGMIPKQGTDQRAQFNPYVKIDTSLASVLPPLTGRNWSEHRGGFGEPLPGEPGYEFPYGPPGSHAGSKLGTDTMIPDLDLGNDPRNGAFVGSHKVGDRGGIIGPGSTLIHNYTGKNELLVPSYALGGFNTAAIIPKKPPPRPPNVIKMNPQPRPAPAPPPPGPPRMEPTAPAPMGPVPGPPPPPPAEGAPGTPMPGVAAPMAPTVMPAQIGTGPGIEGSTEDHLHPAAKKGITSGFAAAGNIAGMAASMGMGGMGGAAGSMIAGAFGQAGKIVEGIANVGAAFLVGNVTNGTTENPYGVTQRGTNPTGGTRISDNSTHYHGNMVTNNLDEYFQRMDLRERQKQQASLGRFG